MTVPVIVPVSETTVGGALAHVRMIREAGQVPLVVDARWPAAHRDAVLAAAASTPLSADTGWAAATSGSSGTPRIVLRTAASWTRSFPALSELLGAGSADRVLLPAPPASSLTLFSLAHALDGGPQPDTAGHAQVLHGTPQALRTLLDAGEDTAVRTALIGGSHLDPALREKAEAAGIRVVSYYGAAELSFVAVDDDGAGLRPFPGVDVQIRDGELWVRSPFVATGYLGAGGPLRRDGDWATVGDRAELIEGRVRLRGRADDAILTASATIVPEEVEAILRTSPGVIDAVVFGWPRPRVGALVAAFLEGDAIDLTAVRRVCAQQLAPAHRPRRWFLGTLPRTASGKPARTLAAQRAIAGTVTPL